MPDVLTGYLIGLLGNFQILLYVWNVISSSNFYKLCIKLNVEMKSKPF